MTEPKSECCGADAIEEWASKEYRLSKRWYVYRRKRLMGYVCDNCNKQCAVKEEE